MQERSRDAAHFRSCGQHNRLPETVTEVAKDADEIWHLGDVCAEAILDDLRAVGPRVRLPHRTEGTYLDSFEIL
jgi:hypothetical protein